MITSCVAVCPPVPALKPMKAVFPPTVPGTLIVQDVVNVALVTASVMVNCQRGAIVGHVHLENIAAMQIYSPGN